MAAQFSRISTGFLGWSCILHEGVIPDRFMGTQAAWYNPPRLFSFAEIPMSRRETRNITGIRGTSAVDANAVWRVFECFSPGCDQLMKVSEDWIEEQRAMVSQLPSHAPSAVSRTPRTSSNGQRVGNIVGSASGSNRWPTSISTSRAAGHSDQAINLSVASARTRESTPISTQSVQATNIVRRRNVAGCIV